MLTLPDYPVRQRDFLLEISRAITAQLDLSEVLRRVLRASVAMTAARVGIVALRSEHDDQFTVRAFTGLQQDRVPLLNAKLMELVSMEQAAFSVEFLNAKLREMSEAIDPALVQAVAMPLIFAEKPLGLLIVFRSYQSVISANDVQILQSFADQAAIAVHNAQLYEAINQERRRLQAILNYSGDGVMILDAHLTIQQVNRAFEHMTGWQSTDAIGLSQEDVIQWVRRDQMDLQEAINAGLFPKNQPSGSTLYVEGDIRRPDGLNASLGITYAPLFNEEGKLISIIANVRDVANYRRAQEMQNVFISTVSHELRTPVAIIKGYASTLNRPDVEWDMAVVRESVAVIEEEADRLAELIDDLLAASKIQAENTVRLTLSDVQLDQLAARAVERFSKQTQRHTFVLSFPSNYPAIQGDARLLRQVIDNLLTNAIKYSPNGGTITVGGRYSETAVNFFVRDEGVGIPESEQQRIFDRFYRIDGNLTSKTKGTGLGLYLVRAIITAHRGEIHVKSQLGHGSTFYFSLPRD
jgi:PAS domain S-box-containing protein